MADHMYKPNEVPKGQRWQYFLDYYKIPTIIAVVSIVAIISILKTTVFAPKNDLNFLAASETYIDYEILEEVANAFDVLPVDFDGDGKKLVSIDAVHLDPESRKNDPEYFQAQQMKFIAALSTANAALQIVDEAMFEYLQQENVVGTYSELSDLRGHAPDDIIKIPLKELKPFKDFAALPDNLFMTLRPEAAMQIGNSEKKLEAYKQQVQALEYMMEP